MFINEQWSNVFQNLFSSNFVQRSMLKKCGDCIGFVREMQQSFLLKTMKPLG